MTLNDQKRLASEIMRLLKVRYVSFPIVTTEKGPLYMKYVKDQEGYELVLDAVPLLVTGLENENNAALAHLLEKRLFTAEE